MRVNSISSRCSDFINLSITVALFNRIIIEERVIRIIRDLVISFNRPYCFAEIDYSCIIAINKYYCTSFVAVSFVIIAKIANFDIGCFIIPVIPLLSIILIGS
jgi:hypothetical protein